MAARPLLILHLIHQSMAWRKYIIAFGLGGILLGAASLGAVQITVPAAPGANYVLLSNSTGNYTAVATSSLGVSGLGGVYVTVGGAGSDYPTTTVASDEIAINNAINYVTALGGGTVFVKQGIYTVNDPVELKSNVTLRGTGWGSVIKAGASMAANEHLIYFNGQINGEVTSIKLDGNRLNQTQDLFGWYVINATSSRFTNNYVTGTRSDAVHIRGTGGNHSVDHNWIMDNGENGIAALNAKDVTISNNVITGNGLISTGGNSIIIGSSLDSIPTTNTRIINNQIGSSTQNAIFLGRASSTAIVGNNITNSTFYGIHSETSYTHPGTAIVGNTFDNNRLGAMGDFTGSYILQNNAGVANNALGIGTTTPFTSLAVVGTSSASQFYAFGTATNTAANGWNIDRGCYSVAGTCLGGGIPGGSNTHVQFNDGGVFGGEADLTWNKTTNRLTLAGNSFIQSGGDGLDLTMITSAGTSNGSSGGTLVLAGGNGSGIGGGNGGELDIFGGDAASGNANGGFIVLEPGAKSGSGTNGQIWFGDPSGINARFDTSSLVSSDKTFTFPNWTGIFAVATSTLQVSAINSTSTTASSFFGSLGIGSTAPGAKLQVTADADFPTVGYNSSQLRITGSTDTNKRINVGFSTTGNFGFIQSAIEGTSYNATAINPHGASVGVGTTTPTAVFQATNATANATTSIQFGKANQNKGTCMTYYDTAGSPVYMFIAAGGTTFTAQNGGTAPSGCQN